MPWPRYVIPLLLLAVAALVYRYDPATTGLYPSCPFHRLTGLECPGCGAQRAAHHLLYGRPAEALSHNALLVVAIPLAIIHFMAVSRRHRHSRWPVVAWGVLIVGWGIARNLWPGC